MALIKVTPEQLNTTASVFSTEASNLANLTGEMLTLVRGSNSAWTGEAANAFVTKFNGLEDDMNRLANMVKEYAADLIEIAANYQRAEEANMQAAQALSADVII